MKLQFLPIFRIIPKVIFLKGIIFLKSVKKYSKESKLYEFLLFLEVLAVNLK